MIKSAKNNLKDIDSDSIDDEDLNYSYKDDDENIDIIIEIDDDSIDSIEDDEILDEIIDNVVSLDDNIINDDIYLSKHKLEGKHSLKYDSIFKGKKEDPISEETYITDFYQKDIIEIDKTSNYYHEYIDNESYYKTKRLKERVYEVLQDKTNVSFTNNRRKPSKSDFNKHYATLKENLKNESFTNVELFNELSFYFSDNLFNMFKLLDNKWRNLIIEELQKHIGDDNLSTVVLNSNIFKGTEIEFEWHDVITGNKIMITGDVIEVDYENSEYKVNSYERVYDINLNQIKKILNNKKFRYNLNKLNNIDFL